MAYIKLWIDPNIISESQIQLPDKVIVGTNEDGSDKYNLTITYGDELNSSPWANEARFCLDPDPKYLQMPIWYAETKDNLIKSYLFLFTRHTGYSSYWTLYIASKLRTGIDTDTYGTYLRLGCKNNVLAKDEINKIATTYNTLEDGTRDYYLLPACAEGNPQKGDYYHIPVGSTISSTYTKDNSSNIGKIISREIDTGTYTSKHVISDNSGIGCAVLIKDRITFEEGVTEVGLPIGNSTNSSNNPGAFKLCKADGYYYFEIWTRGVNFSKSEPLQNFDITKTHTYVIIFNSSPNYTVELWIDGKQYKKEDGTDFTNFQAKYEKLSLSTYQWDDFNTHNIYDFRLIQGEEPGDLNYYDIVPLVASITASRNPVTVNVPSLSTSELTCHAEGLLPMPKVDITNFFDQGICTIEGLVIDPNSHLPKILTHDYHGTTWAHTTGCYIMDYYELEVIDDTIIKRTSNHTSSGYTITGNDSTNNSASGYIINIDCKVEKLSEGINTIIGGDNAAYDNAYLYAGVAIKSIGDNKYRIYVYDNGVFYSEIYEYNPFEWHTYTICHNAYHGTLYLFIDNNFILSVKKFHNRGGKFCLYLGNLNQSTNDRPLFTNTVLFKNIKEYYFYNTYAEVMNSILYFNSKYIEILDSYIDCTGDYVKYTDANGTEAISDVPTVNNEYFIVDVNWGITIPNGSSSSKFTEYNYVGDPSKRICYLWEEDSQIISLNEKNPLVQIQYGPPGAATSLETPSSNAMKLIPIEDNKFILKCNKFTSQEFEGFYEKHNYKIYFLNESIEQGYCVYDVYIDNIKAIFTTEEGEIYHYIKVPYLEAMWSAMSRVTMNYFIPAILHISAGNIVNPTRFYSRKVYKVFPNPDYEEYPELTYLWDTGETTKQITVQPTEPTTYTCTVTQGSRTASASILINTMLKYTKPVAVISPQSKPYVEHMLGKFYGTNSYDTNEPEGEIIKYIWNGVETASPVLTTRVTKTDIITLQVVNIYGEISDEVQVDLSQGGFDQWGYSYKFLDFPVFLVCSKGASLYDTLMSRFPIPTSTKDLYTTRYDTEYPQYTRIGFTTDISNDTITYMGCFPHYGVAEYTAPRDELDIYPLGVSWLEKRKILKYFDKVKGSKGSLLTCIGHPEIKEEGYGNLEFVLNALGIITPKDRYTIPRLLDLLELFLIDYENGGLIEL